MPRISTKHQVTLPGEWRAVPCRRPARDHRPMLCAMTGLPHRLFWMRSAWWCQDCRQKVESCCEGGGCPSVSEVLPRTNLGSPTNGPAEQAAPAV
jgi:hypothetical protein